MAKNVRPAILGRQFRSDRFIGTPPPLPQALLQVAHICSRELSLPPLGFTGMRKQPITLDEETFTALLEEIETAHRNNNFSSFCLWDAPVNSTFSLWLSQGFRPQVLEQVQFREPEKFPLDALLTAIQKICSTFGAFQGYVWDSLLHNLHQREIRAYELDLAELPPEEHQFILKPEIIQGVPDTLPPLLLCSEFDYTSIPDGVWWINYWSSKYVETIGFDRIRSADWFRMIEQPEGGVVLVLTEEPTDVRIPEHRDKIGEVVEHLRLRELQECYRVNR